MPITHVQGAGWASALRSGRHVLRRSTARGLSLSIAFFVVEGLMFPALLGLGDWVERLESFVLMSSVDKLMEVGSPDSLLLPALTVAAYTVVAGAATLWLFEKRDIAGPRGE